MQTKKENKKYITTPIYYVNDKPHIGHAYTTLVADVFARFYRRSLGNENVFFLTGLDEHGNKVENSAKKNGIEPQAYADKMAEVYKSTWERLNIKYDEFIRTTDERHVKIVQEYLKDLNDKGYIYKGNYKGFYCVGCEKYLRQDEISNGVCILHPNLVLEEQEEVNYFFNLKKLAKDVLNELEKGTYIVMPEERKNEIVSRINSGIEDVSISRPGVKWGIPLPWDEQQTVYVWIDALLNYYSATKIYNKEKFWSPDIQFMAKDILWFHALVWEGLLLANGILLPKIIYAHGFFTVDGQKMSKTLGNIVDPIQLIDIFGVDGTRYLLLTCCPFGSDGDISMPRFNEKFNADLANGLGNLVSRVAKLCEEMELTVSNEADKQEYNKDFENCMQNMDMDAGISSVWQRIANMNVKISEEKLWALPAEEKKKKLADYIAEILQISYDLSPFMPETSEKINKIFTPGEKIIKPQPLFLRVNK